jgi:hypothetical protein
VTEERKVDRELEPVYPQPELKPCPFCGGPVQLERAKDTRDPILGARRWYGVVCRNLINLGGTCAIQQRPSATQEAAIERWNMRNGEKA